MNRADCVRYWATKYKEPFTDLEADWAARVAPIWQSMQRPEGAEWTELETMLGFRLPYRLQVLLILGTYNAPSDSEVSSQRLAA